MAEAQIKKKKKNPYSTADYDKFAQLMQKGEIKAMKSGPLKGIEKEVGKGMSSYAAYDALERRLGKPNDYKPPPEKGFFDRLFSSEPERVTNVKPRTMEEQSEAIRNAGFVDTYVSPKAQREFVPGKNPYNPMEHDKYMDEIYNERAQKRKEMDAREERMINAEDRFANRKRISEMQAKERAQQQTQTFQDAEMQSRKTNQDFSKLNKKERTQAKEETGNYYVDPTTGFALNLGTLKKRIDRKKIMQEAQLLPASTRAQYLASKGVIDPEDIPVDQEAELKKKYYQLQIANASLKLANEKKKMDPMQEKYFDLAKTAIGNQQYYIATEMLEKAGITDLDMEKMMKMDGKYNASLLKGAGVKKIMEQRTGHTPEQISNKKTKVQQSLKKLSNPATGETGERAVLLRKYGLTDSFDENNNPVDLSKVTMVNTAKQGEEPFMVNDLKLNLWTRANDPQFQSLPGADIFIDQVKKIPNDISNWSAAEYDRWISETVVEMELAGSVNNYMEYRNTLEQLKAQDSGKTLKGATGKEETTTKPKEETKPDPEPDKPEPKSLIDEGLESNVASKDSIKEEAKKSGIDLSDADVLDLLKMINQRVADSTLSAAQATSEALGLFKETKSRQRKRPRARKNN